MFVQKASESYPMKPDLELPLNKEVPLYPTVKQSLQMFSLCVILFVFLASYFQRQGFISGVLITQFVFILLPPVIYLLYKKMDWKYSLRLNKVSPKNILYCIGILLFSLPLVYIVNGLYLIFINRIIGTINIPNIPIANNFLELIIYFFVIGVSAGICEEILFRGYIMKGLENLGAKRSILISGFLFSILHISIEKLPATFLLGVIIGFAVYVTNSIYTGIVLHFFNNSLSVLLSFIVIGNNPSIKDITYPSPPDFSSLSNLNSETILALGMLSIFVIVFATGCIRILYFLITKLLENTSSAYFSQTTPNKVYSKKDFLWVAPGFLLILIITTGEILSSLNIEFDFYKKLLSFLLI